MDVSTPASAAHVRSRRPIYREISCDACGYPRTGLTDGSVCPECGGAPPVVVASTSKNAIPITQGNQTWIRSISAGLILLTLSYIWAFQVIISMPIGRYVASAYNVPAPKIAPAALILRSIGGKAGPDGVSGVLAVMTSVLAIWILTQPRTSRSDSGQTLPWLLRWTTVITVGGVFGLTLAWNQMGSESTLMRNTLILALLGCDLPVNLLLYLHLRKVAGQLDQPRAAEAFAWCSWGIPILIVLSAGLIPILHLISSEESLWQLGLISAGVGSLSLIAGVMATVAVLRLVIVSSSAAFGQYAAAGTRALLRLPVLIKMLATSVQRESARFAIVLGIALWLCTIAWTMQETLWSGTRHATGGDMPYVNFIGPKISIATITIGNWNGYFPYGVGRGMLIPILLQSLAIWLITMQSRTTRKSSILLAATRILAILGTGAAMGWSLWIPQRWDNELYAIRRAEILIVATLAFELPATVLLYWSLAAIARQYGLVQLNRRLRYLALGVGVLLVLPLGFFALASVGYVPHKVSIAAISASLIMAAEVAVGLFALTSIAQLGWRLAINPYQPRVASLSSPQDDPSIANTSPA